MLEQVGRGALCMMTWGRLVKGRGAVVGVAMGVVKRVSCVVVVGLLVMVMVMITM